MHQRWLKQHADHFTHSLISPKNRLRIYQKQLLVDHKPLQYILKTQPFVGLDIACRRPVLIPRPETEQYTRFLIRILSLRATQRRRVNILDMCSGSGCISVAIARHCQNCDILGLDISPVAIMLSRLNARKFAPHGSNTLRFEQTDLFQWSGASTGNQFDLIVSNPPYIADAEYPTLDENVRLWEDRAALVGTSNADGLRYYDHIISQSSQLLRSDGIQSSTSMTVSRRDAIPYDEPAVDQERIPRLVLETGGDHQTEAILEMLRAQKIFKDVSVFKDFRGVERVIFGY